MPAEILTIRRPVVTQQQAQLDSPPQQPAAPLLVCARQAAALCAVSLATWWRWDAAGRMPAGVKIGGAKRWRADELRSWISSGCPDRARWSAMQGRGPKG